MCKWLKLHVLALLTVAGHAVLAQELNHPAESSRDRKTTRARDEVSATLLSGEEWRRVDEAVKQALSWLANQQRPDGSFPTVDRGQPGVTSLCVLAFMAHGHNPGEGVYGQRLDRATDYILSCEKPNGLVTLLGPDGPTITHDVANEIGEPAAYNHAIASLTISEMYGIGQSRRAAQLDKVIEKSIAATLIMQRWPKDLPVDQGGWRYVTDDGLNDADLSITGWQLMFLRSARNAGFNVPQEPIDNAIKYIRRAFDQRIGTFVYTIQPNPHYSRAMAGAGILALAHAGFHNSPEAQSAGKWLLEHRFDEYNANDGSPVDRYHYSLFNACQAMYQLGSPYWEKFYPRTVAALLAHQRPNGSWDAESLSRDKPFGNSYTTALVVLALGAPNQFLPVFQR
jgi:hypothetical protein